MSITFDEIRDKSVVDWLRSLKNKLRSSAIRTVLRCSLEHPCLFLHYITPPAHFLANPPKEEAAGNVVKVDATETCEPTILTESLPALASEEVSEEVDDDFNLFALDDMDENGGEFE